MTFEFDPEVAATLTALAAAGPAPIPPARGDWKTQREQGNETMATIASMSPPLPSVSITELTIPVAEGVEVAARWYTRADSAPGSAVVYAHGGGMICGFIAAYDGIVSSYVEASGVPFLSVEYRLAPEVHGTTLADDTYAALRWLQNNAEKYGVEPARVAVMGDSAGGGVAAGVAVLARDHGTPLASQILVYPMLDDRNTEPDENMVPFANWTYDNNYTGWHALLGDDIGTDKVSPVAAPARLKDFTGMAPAFIDVGELDIFRDESILFARNLTLAGTSVELHVRSGAPHGFDLFTAGGNLGTRATADRVRILRTL
jgi:acetyl esterase/lipase